MNFHTVQEMSQGAHAGTMWKFQDYSVIQILCEINIGEFRSSKRAVFAFLGL